MDTLTRPDERAAGVISGSDPYKELELYLEKVNEEIGEVFDKWSESQQPKTKKSDETNETAGVGVGRLSSWTENVLASWSEFDRVIAQELSALMADTDAADTDGGVAADDHHDAGTDSSGGSSPNFSHLHDDEADSGLERSAEVLDRASVTYEDCGAQTSPAVSRSSSFTWLSDSSSLPEEDNSTSTSSSSSSSPHPDSSGDSHKGGNSPPPAPSPKSCQKCRRKETWERLRRRQSNREGQSPGSKETVWVRRQSHAMPESSSEPDLVGDRGAENPRYPGLPGRPGLPDDYPGLSSRPSPAVRPTTLRLGPPSSCSGSSLPSPSSECGGETAAGSPQQELSTSKSSSAPLLHHNRSSTLPHSKGRGKPRSQSEKQLPVEAAGEDVVEAAGRSGGGTGGRSGGGREGGASTCCVCAWEKRDGSSEKGAAVAVRVAAESLRDKKRPLRLFAGAAMAEEPREYKFFRSFSAKVESGWPMRKAEQFWRRLRERKIAEIEASEACQWLRAAGFPQYAQMYEDLQFPIEVNGVQKDHPFLDPDSLQSLFRRLHALNRCANMKLDAPPKPPRADDSDEDDQCALSENWTFQPEIRRWSRVTEVTPQKLAQLQAASKLASKDSEGTKGKDVPVIRYGSLPPGALSPDSELLAAKFRRSGSERLRDGAKAFLRRVESLKSRRRKRHNRDGVIISGPQVVDIASMERRMRDLNCVDVTPPESPIDMRGSRRFLTRPDSDSGALSDSELPWRQHYYKDANSNNTKVLDFSEIRGGSAKERLSPSSRSTSLTSTPDRDTFRSPRVFRKPPEITVFKESEFESGGSSSALADSDSDTTPRTKGVTRWHSFQRASVRPESYIGQPVSSMSSGQLLVLRKLALLKLTSIMEKHCPTHRTGWNWELPKFMRKIKNPDYKDKTVFGVPLVVSLQRSGQTLPMCIQIALSWLRTNALEQVGLFRKPGVKSRIQKLKTMAESQGDEISFEGQQAFDVADMVKQYFRELPEALLTNKLSDTFIAIFQHVPVGLRIEAVQCALLLLPDEHREALQFLLHFLADVAAFAPTNQMTASNLSVCLAPSLFHWTTVPSRNTSASPRRNNGVPDPRQLGHNKAAHDCLLAFIKNYKEVFNICDELLAQCHFSYMEESIPVALDDLGSDFGQDWKGYLNACQSALLKEAREKSRGWVSNGNWMGVDVSYKKVGDGHPLRLWRVSTEVEAPPTELLHRVLRERQLWDSSLVKWRVVTRLDTNAEVFQYLTASISPIPSKDYCVLRTWKTELAKGACVIVETSVEHPEGQVLSGGIRGILLASRYLIEPCGSGKSRIIHLSRVDTKGRTPDWYNKVYGHLCALHLFKIRTSFRHVAEGPESKV